MKSQKRIISGERSGAAEAWVPPAVQVGGGGNGIYSSSRPVTAAQLEAIHRQAYEEGLARGLEEGRSKGYQEGVEQAKVELESRAGRLEGLLRSLGRPLEVLDGQIEEQLVALAMSVAKHLVRRELKSDPGQVIAVVREAVSVLPLASQTLHLHLHPEDAALVREMLPVNGADVPWQIVEDPVLTRGGCRVATEISQVDATVENRVARVVAKVMGEERDIEPRNGS